jgi:protocatechuate 3,4-dioxygenase beta subunit
VAAHAPGFGSYGAFVDIGASQPAQVAVVLPSECVLHVRAQDGAGAPVRGAVLVVRCADGSFAEAGFELTGIELGRGITDDRGRLVRRGLAPGRYSVQLRAGERTGRADVDLPEGATEEILVTIR